MTNSQYWQPVRWQPQQEIDGKYVIVGVLGGGGFGSAYKATEKRTGKTVAIKTLNLLQQADKTLDQFEELQLKFENEALRLATCNHPHVVRVYELVRFQGLKGMVMEYIKGKNLAEIVEDSGPMSFQQAFQIIEQIGSALTRVHENELLHRDIKPQNIMLRRPGGKEGDKAVLIDFGLARSFLPGRTDSITDLGTVCYAPIEQYSRQGVFGPYTDVYALAATMYYLRTGERPTPANFRQEKVPLTEPKQHNSQIPDWENEAILQGLQLQPTDRPQTVAAWLKLFAQANSLPTFEFTVVTVNDRGREIDRQRRSAEFFAEDLGNGVILEMVSIPGGSFLMGSPDGEGSSDERPQHRVTVPGFFMGKYPVTQAQYRAVMGDNPSRFKGENLPVECVTWYDAEEFCKKLAAKTGKSYRLPSEAEWEYACRAGTTTPFHFGETITSDLANYRGTSIYASEPKGQYREKTTPVGSFKVANAFGLFDMHGNVVEWCQDIWHGNYQGAPTDGSPWIADEQSDIYGLLRGGYWSYDPRNCRSANRSLGSPVNRSSLCGFRVFVVRAARTL